MFAPQVKVVLCFLLVRLQVLGQRVCVFFLSFRSLKQRPTKFLRADVLREEGEEEPECEI